MLELQEEVDCNVRRRDCFCFILQSLCRFVTRSESVKIFSLVRSVLFFLTVFCIIANIDKELVMPVLKIKSLSKIYGTEHTRTVALDDVSFEVERGEFVAIVGTSGSGKSTLLHTIAGVEVPTSGSVFVEDVDVHRQNDKEMSLYRRKKVALIYQGYNLLPMLNVRDNITLPAELDGRKVEEKRLLDVLNVLGISEKEFHYPNMLSGGQQQRVAIARALITEPAILLADEPTGNLDSSNTSEIMALFALSNEQYGQTIIVVTHDDRVAMATRRIIRIEDGRIVEDTRK